MIAIASDHAGYSLKQELLDHLKESGIPCDDLGCESTASVDYPVYAKKLCDAVLAGKYEQGILVCGTGIGMSIAANKFDGITAALCSDCFSAEMSRQHNNANVLCLGARVIGPELAKRILDTFLSADFSEKENHIRRNEMVKGFRK